MNDSWSNELGAGLGYTLSDFGDVTLIHDLTLTYITA